MKGPNCANYAFSHDTKKNNADLLKHWALIVTKKWDSSQKLLKDLHLAVWPFLMADKIIGSQNHFTGLTVKTWFVPILKEKRGIFHAEREKMKRTEYNSSLKSVQFNWSKK